MEELIIAGSVLLGSVISGTIGWLGSNEPFVAKKFIATIMSGIGGAIAFALAYGYTASGLSTFDILIAIAAGMGVDVGVHRVVGAVGAKLGKV